MRMVGAAADNPQDGAGGINKKELPLLVEQAEMMVGEVVAEELGAGGHAEGLEAVAFVPVAQGERQRDGVGIEKGDAIGQRPEHPTESVGGIGEIRNFDDKVLCERRGIAGERCDDERASVQKGTVRVGIELTAGLGGGKDGGHSGGIEAVGAEQLVEELAVEVGGAVLRGEAERGGAVGSDGEELPAHGLEQGLQEPVGGLEVADGLLEGAVGGRLQLAQHREELVANLVAAVFERSIGGVFDMVEGILGGIGLNILASERQQRPHDTPLDGQDAAEAGEAGAAEQVDEEGFGCIIAMMGGEDGGIALGLEQLVEVAVTEVAGSLFDAEVMLGSIRTGVELGHMDWDAVAGSQLAHEMFVAVAVSRTEMEVAMGHGEGVAGGVHEVREDDGVDASANSKQHLLPRREEVLLGDVFNKTLKHYLTIILCIRRSPLNSIP